MDSHHFHEDPNPVLTWFHIEKINFIGQIRIQKPAAPQLSEKCYRAQHQSEKPNPHQRMRIHNTVKSCTVQGADDKLGQTLRTHLKQ